MNNYVVSIVSLFVASILTTCLGCGSNRPETAPVGGRVMFQGKPVPEGRILFLPEHGRPAVGKIGPDGRYVLTTFVDGDGAIPGRHRVVIEAKRVSGPPPPKTPEEEIRVPQADPKAFSTVWLVPEKYSRSGTSPLTAEVQPGPNDINFDL